MDKLGIYITLDWLRWSVKNLKPRELSIFQAMLCFLNIKTKTAWPSYQVLEKMTGLSRSSLHRSIDTLIKLHVLKRISKPGTNVVYEFLTFKNNRLEAPLSGAYFTEAEVEDFFKKLLED